MAGEITARTVNALKYVFYANMTPYAAARKAQINLSTIYRQPLLKQWNAGDRDGARRELAKLDGSQALPRYAKRRKGAVM